MLYIMLAAFFYTAAIMFVTFATRAINSSLVTVIVNVISIIIPLIVVLPNISKRVSEGGKAGIIAAVVAGVLISLYTLFLSKSFQVNKVALVTPIVFGGMIFLTAILSYFIFKEKLPPIHLTGLLVLGVGLSLIIYSAANRQIITNHLKKNFGRIENRYEKQ